MTAAARPGRFRRGMPRAEGLLGQVAWFNRMRLGAVGGLLLLSSGGLLLGVVADPMPLYALAFTLLVVNLAYMRHYPRLGGVPVSAVRRHVDLQIAIDLLLLTAMLHFSGGVTNPFVLFYLFHSFIASMLLSVRAGVVVALLSIALMGGLGLAEFHGWLPHRPLMLGWMRLEDLSGLGLAVWLAALAVTILGSVYFVARVLRQLRRQEGELVALNRQLAQSEKLASVGTLAAGVSHEINNPIGVIQNKVQILRYRIGDGDPKDRLLAELATIEKHTQRIGEITRGLLTFSKETPFEIERLAVGRVVEEAVDLVRVPFRVADVRLHTHLDGRAPPIEGSRNHLLQVLVNLLLNARDASASGSEVRVETAVEDEQVLIRVADRGEGIAAANLAKIFDPFFTTKDVGVGTGLGLAISHGIVERLRGTIEVASRPGEGATFTVRLPAAPDDAAGSS